MRIVLSKLFCLGSRIIGYVFGLLAFVLFLVILLEILILLMIGSFTVSLTAAFFIPLFWIAYEAFEFAKPVILPIHQTIKPPAKTVEPTGNASKYLIKSKFMET